MGDSQMCDCWPAALDVPYLLMQPSIRSLEAPIDDWYFRAAADQIGATTPGEVVDLLVIS